MFAKRILAVGITFCLTLALLGCNKSASQAETSASPSKSVSPQSPINIVATTGMIADIAAQVGGNLVHVTGLMGPGVDPHLYKASEGDIHKLSNADIIFYNGLNLEGKMTDIFVKMARKKPTVAVSDAIDPKLLREPPEFAGHYDPHVWFDVSMWSQAVTEVAQALSEYDPAHANTYQSNAKTYISQLDALDRWCREQIAQIPKDQRVLITAHDAFGYFGRAYNIDVVGLQGISTVSEFGLKDIQRIVDLIVERKVKAVFIESSVPKRSIDAVVAGVKANGHDVAIGGTLFSDAMGTPGTPEGHYIGMVRANVTTITNALLGKAPH
ncbi:MAG: manganese transporter [Deltaproteobacteria bacterium CG11_big_fil_rev_8_21_14_0_20_47_16]|nr:MAG: manganese transporter [Deltaproteobacteria bacterium CG11_big_fil_rev_8_21_14_0_20_47_16]